MGHVVRAPPRGGPPTRRGAEGGIRDGDEAHAREKRRLDLVERSGFCLCFR
jgi:hypothetical protein